MVLETLDTRNWRKVRDRKQIRWEAWLHQLTIWREFQGIEIQTSWRGGGQTETGGLRSWGDGGGSRETTRWWSQQRTREEGAAQWELQRSPESVPPWISWLLISLMTVHYLVVAWLRLKPVGLCINNCYRLSLQHILSLHRWTKIQAHAVWDRMSPSTL